MKGIIFNLVEDAVIDQHGEAAWDALLSRSGVEGTFTSLGNYADTDLMALIDAGAQLLDTTPTELTRQLGHAALLGLAERYPHFFEPHQDPMAFLLTLNDVIHPEVRKVHEGASPPDFWFDGVDGNRLTIHYRSDRQLCALAEGMIGGAATYYGTSVDLAQSTCMLDGADHCAIEAAFTS